MSSLPSMPETSPLQASLLDSKVIVPKSVVYRALVNETVVLNLQTGIYHGLNATAGRMLELLERCPSVREAAGEIAAEYERPLAEIERDVLGLCSGLLEHGLIEVRSPEHS